MTIEQLLEKAETDEAVRVALTHIRLWKANRDSAAGTIQRTNGRYPERAAREWGRWNARVNAGVTILATLLGVSESHVLLVVDGRYNRVNV